MHGLLQKGEAVGVRPAALTGMGGIGKTQLAVEYAYRYRDAYPGGIYWVNAAENWQREIASLAEKVGLREDGAPEEDRQRLLAVAFAKYLDEHPGALAIFDNVEDPRSLHGIIPAQLHCHLLFTTRRRDSAGAFTAVEVGALPEAESLDLLLASEERRPIRDGGAEGELDAAKAICRVLGHLPLALTLAGAYVGQNPKIPLVDYRERLAREGALTAVDDSGVAAEDLPTRHAAAVHSTLELQWKALKGEAQRDVLRTAALFGEAAESPRARLALLTGMGDRAEKGRAAPLAPRPCRSLELVGRCAFMGPMSSNAVASVLEQLPQEPIVPGQDPERGSGEPEAGPAPSPDEPARWREWLEAMRVGAGERIAAARREMQAQGVLDAEGKLTPGDLPADMRPGSTSSVSTG